MVGSANTDVVGRVPRFPHDGECLTGSTFAIGQGGKGANQAVMAARLGAAVDVVARLGDDLFGAVYRERLAAEGIGTAAIVTDPARASGVAMILVEEGSGRNTIAYLPGANAGLSADDVAAAAAWIDRADVVICQLETPVDATLAAFTRAGAVSPRPIRILNSAPVPVPPVPLPAALVAATDVLVANEEEASWLAGRAVATPEAARTAAEDLARAWDATVVITLGAAGVVHAGPGTPAVHVPVPAVRAVDTTGAGDAFVGSLAVRLGSGDPVAVAVPRAAAIATLSVGRAGAQASYPTRAEVDAALGA